MCGRFGLVARLDAIEDYYDAEFIFDYEPQYNIAPEGDGIAAVRNQSPDEINKLQGGLLSTLGESVITSLFEACRVSVVLCL